MNYIRKHVFPFVACVITIVLMFAGYYTKDMLFGDDTIVYAMALSAVITVVLLSVDSNISAKKQMQQEEDENEQISQMESEIESLDKSLKRLQREKDTIYNSYCRVNEEKESLKKTIEEKENTITYLNGKIEELSSPKRIVADTKSKDASQGDVPQDVSYPVFCDTVVNWVADCAKPVRNIRKYFEAAEEKELLKDSEIVNSSIEKILYLTTIDKIQPNLRIENCSLNDIVKDVLKKYTQTFNDRKIGLIRKGLEMNVEVDKRWFSYAFSQVILNSLYSTGEFGKMAVTAKEDTDGVLLAVEDSSMGLREDELSLAFEPGFVSHEAERISGKESMMCLYLAKKAVEKFGGEIAVESKYGKGTKVYIKIPYQA